MMTTPSTTAPKTTTCTSNTIKQCQNNLYKTCKLNQKLDISIASSLTKHSAEQEFNELNSLIKREICIDASIISKNSKQQTQGTNANEISIISTGFDNWIGNVSREDSRQFEDNFSSLKEVGKKTKKDIKWKNGLSKKSQISRNEMKPEKENKLGLSNNDSLTKEKDSKIFESESGQEEQTLESLNLLKETKNKTKGGLSNKSNKKKDEENLKKNKLVKHENEDEYADEVEDDEIPSIPNDSFHPGYGTKDRIINEEDEITQQNLSKLSIADTELQNINDELLNINEENSKKKFKRPAFLNIEEINNDHHPNYEDFDDEVADEEITSLNKQGLGNDYTNHKKENNINFINKKNYIDMLALGGAAEQRTTPIKFNTSPDEEIQYNMINSNIIRENQETIVPFSKGMFDRSCNKPKPSHNKFDLKEYNELEPLPLFKTTPKNEENPINRKVLNNQQKNSFSSIINNLNSTFINSFHLNSSNMQNQVKEIEQIEKQRASFHIGGSRINKEINPTNYMSNCSTNLTNMSIMSKDNNISNIKTPKHQKYTSDHNIMVKSSNNGLSSGITSSNNPSIISNNPSTTTNTSQFNIQSKLNILAQTYTPKNEITTSIFDGKKFGYNYNQSKSKLDGSFAAGNYMNNTKNKNSKLFKFLLF